MSFAPLSPLPLSLLSPADVQGLECGVYGVGFTDQDSRFTGQGSGFTGQASVRRA